MDNERESAIFYRSFYEAIKLQPKEIQADLYNALLEYTFTGELPESDNLMVQGFFILMKPQIDANNKKYEDGRKGGRPKKEKTSGFEENENSKTSGFENNKTIKTSGFENCENSKTSGYEKSEMVSDFEKPNVNDNDNVNVNENENENENENVNVNENENVNEKHSYQLIADMYNATCVTLPKCTTLSESRKKALRARLNHYGIDDFQRLFEKANESSFLTGANNNNWTANFDWLIKDANMAKVLDGNYDNKPRASGGGGSGNPFMDMYYKLKEEEDNNDESGYSSDFGSF